MRWDESYILFSLNCPSYIFISRCVLAYFVSVLTSFPLLVISETGEIVDLQYDYLKSIEQVISMSLDFITALIWAYINVFKKTERGPDPASLLTVLQ